MPFRYGVSPNFYSINVDHSVKPRPYGYSPNALKSGVSLNTLKAWAFTECTLKQWDTTLIFGETPYLKGIG
jgi:hypothetical protein